VTTEQLGPSARGVGDLFRDFYYYLGWWCLWVGLGSFLQPVVDPEWQRQFWLAKAIQLGTGLSAGALSALLFTMLQNLVNWKRRRAVSWVLAIGIFMLVKVLAALVFT
jgi:hypothetical protein